jgi:hypothetical protein
VELLGGLLIIILGLAVMLRRANKRNAEQRDLISELDAEKQRRVNVDTITKGDDEDAGNPS